MIPLPCVELVGVVFLFVLQQNGVTMSMERNSRTRVILGLLILSSCIGCDQATKYVATMTLQNTAPKSLLGDTVQLGYAQNPGGFLSLGSNLPAPFRMYTFVGVNVVLMVALLVFLVNRKQVRNRCHALDKEGWGCLGFGSRSCVEQFFCVFGSGRHATGESERDLCGR